MNNRINIVYASDDNFAEIMGVSIISLFENNKDISFYIYILESNIGKNNKKKINSIFNKYKGNRIEWITGINIEEILNIKVEKDRGSISQFSRLFITRVLPENIEKILYFDCDIIIRGSIKELWNQSLDDNIIAALKDPFSKYYRRNLGLRDNDILFNSGIMLIDMNMWRKEKVEKRLLKFITDYNGLIPQGDQGALGAILSNDVKILDPKYNFITLFYDFNYKDMIIYRKPVEEYYSEIEIENAKKNPVIIHFTTSFKSLRPWIEGSNHPYKEEWLYYKKISPWANNELRKYKNSSIYKELYIKIERKLPKWIAIRLSGFLQAYGRPWILKLKYKL